MNRLIIDNIGPISHVELPINKLNVIIGRQSSGKSTIAKILSFCQWLEKDVVSHQEKGYIDGEFLRRQLLEYHKISNYMNDGAYIHYDGDYITFDFRSISDFTVSMTDNFRNSVKGKVAYIPAERNLVAITNISTLSLERNYVRDFLFNWLSVRSKFKRENAVSIIDLNIKYYYDEDLQTDRIILPNGRELGIEEVSSGMQSVIPLYVYLMYVTKWIFEHDEETSYDKYSVLQKALLRAVSDDIDDDQIAVFLSMPDLQKKLSATLQMLKRVTNEQVQQIDNLTSVTNLVQRIGSAHYVNLIIEEPELSLFPQTQDALIYDLLREIDFTRDKLLLTTHSPYTLYAINNCMLSYKVKDKLEEDEKANVPSFASMIDPNWVSVWGITDDGTITDIKTSPIGLIGKHYFNQVMNDTLDEYHLMLDYLE